MEISLDAEDLAFLLLFYAEDWQAVLGFIENVAKSRNIEIDVDTVSTIIRKDYADGQ